MGSYDQQRVRLIDQIGMNCMTTSTHNMAIPVVGSQHQLQHCACMAGKWLYFTAITFQETNLIAKPAPYSNLLYTSSVLGVGVGDVAGCIDDDTTTTTGVIDDVDGADGMMVVVNAVGLGTGVDVWSTKGVAMATSVDVKSSVIVGIIILLSSGVLIPKSKSIAVVADGRGAITAMESVDCPLTRSSINTSINKPMHLLHCLSIFLCSAPLYAVALCLSVLHGAKQV